MKVKVRINGSEVNPWNKMGLKANPFPQIAKAEFAPANEILRKLDSDPIRNIRQLREILDGCSSEFIDLCVAQFVPGERVEFVIEFPYP